MTREDAESATPLGPLVERLAGLHSDAALAFLDAVLVVLAYLLILVVRFDGTVPESFQDTFLLFATLAVVTHLAVNWVWGLYGEMWRYASVQEARRILLAGGTSLAILVLISYDPRLVPLSVSGLGAGLATLLLGLVRFQSRLFAFRRRSATDESQVLVVGAGDSGAQLVRDMLASSEAGLRPVVVLDDDLRKHGRSLHGIPVEGPVDRLPALVSDYAVDQVVLAIPSAGSDLIGRVADLADQAGLPVKVLPPVDELVNGRISVRDVRSLRIDDLLGRDQVTIDLDAVHRLLEGRRVLITGGGGSIGSEIARQVAGGDPAAVLLLDHDETHLYETAATVDGPVTQLLVDVRDRVALGHAFTRYRPDVVFHAAAHKHVPLLESHPCEAAETNVLGTVNVAEAAVEHRVERCILISTDKAVRPSSVMGASKRVAERVILERTDRTRFAAVRFGNVLGSRGSVVPRFMRQIEAGGPVTVTDERMTRFFMSIPEAVQLVLQAAVFAEGGEIFMLEMGEPVRILDLAQRMIRLSGRRLDHDVEIEITGVRPGEKLEEELLLPELESRHTTPHPSIHRIVSDEVDRVALDEEVAALREAVAERDDARARVVLQRLAGAPDLLVDLTTPPVRSAERTSTEGRRG